MEVRRRRSSWGRVGRGHAGRARVGQGKGTQMYAWCRAIVLGLVGIALACGPGQAPPASNPPPAQPAAASAPARPAGALATGAAWEAEWSAVLAAPRQEGRAAVPRPPRALLPPPLL